MSEAGKALLFAAGAAAFAAIFFWGGSVYGHNKAREQVFLTCVFAQQATPVSAATHICVTITGIQ